MEDPRRALESTIVAIALCLFAGTAHAAAPTELDKARELVMGWRLDEAEAALAPSNAKTSGPEREVLLATIDYRRSKYEGAIRRLEPVVAKSPDHWEARVVLGRALLATGRNDEAFKVLDVMADAYNDDKITSARDLGLLGVALQLTDYVKNANRVFQEALQKEPDNVDVKLAWAELLLSKYNYLESDKLYREVLKQRPGDAAATLGAARVAIASDAAYAEASEALTALLVRAPSCVPAHAILASIDLQNERPEEAIQRLESTALKLAPNDNESLALNAAAHYLLDDAKGYAAAEKRALAVNPKSVELYVTVATNAERVHRYAEAKALLEKALVFAPESGDALAGVGVAWSRLGDDEQARKTLQQAFDADPYNVKTFNLLEHFYDKVDRDFVWIDAKPMRLRVDKREKQILERYLPKLVGEAYAHFSKKYGFQPKPPLNIEVFPDTETFAVRSVGLPGLAAHGICFGHVVTARSPSAGNFNWGEVLWHELAHVFHIQISDSRVPRWFTEGFAVYESIEGRKAWQREQDRDLWSARKAKKLRGFADFNLAFTQAKSLDDILVAYYHAFYVARFMNTELGFANVKKMLELWGKRKSTTVVVKEALGLTVAELDAKFFAWLDKDLAYLDAAYPFDLAGIGAEADLHILVVEGVDSAIPPAADYGKAAVAKLAKGDVDGAAKYAEDALKQNPDEPLALFVRGMITSAKDGNVADFERLVALGKAGVDVRRALAGAAAKKGDHAAAAAHLEAAVKLDPKDLGLYGALVDALERAGKPADAFAWMAKQAELDQMDAALMVKLLADAKERKASKADVLKWGEQATHVAPFALEVHLAYARAAAAVGAKDVARFEAASALILDPTNAEAKTLAK